MKKNNLWLSAIEALLHMQQVDLPIILELIKSVPNVSDELGRNARELVAIRVLENLYAREVRRKNSSVMLQESHTVMDVYQFCEEVVNFVFQGESQGNLGFADSCILELDVPSFNSEKSSRVQNCSLHQLKDRILEGSNPILRSLKDGRGLEVPDEDSGISVDGDVSDGMADKHVVYKSSKAKRKLEFFTAEGDGISEESLLVKKLSPAKRVRNIVVAKNCEVLSREPCRTFEESRKKLTTVLLCFPKKRIAASPCRHEQSRDSSSRAVEHIGKHVDWETGPEVYSTEKRKGREDHCATASARLTENNDIDPGVVFESQQRVSYANYIPEDMRGKDSISFRINVDHAMSKDNDVHGDNLKISSDSDEYHDVRTDIATTKNSFLSSQGIDTQDSLGTQLNSCVKCNKGCNLLFCSSSGCPLVVHEKCLGSAVDFSRMGVFYCPFCVYSRSISRYLEAKKKFSLSRTDLTTFHVFRANLEGESTSKRSRRSN